MKPIPIIDNDSASYWSAAQLGKLSLPKCTQCKKFFFPPRHRCHDCMSENVKFEEVSGKGTLYSFSVMHMPLVAGFKPPYIIAWIEIAEQPGLLLSANLIDCPPEAAKIGMDVEVVFEKLTNEISLPQFKPSR